jgi:hypothetical protein
LSRIWGVAMKKGGCFHCKAISRRGYFAEKGDNSSNTLLIRGGDRPEMRILLKITTTIRTGWPHCLPEPSRPRQ